MPPEDNSKDVVGARIDIDITKVKPKFKEIDIGAKQNTESFKKLNAELAKTEKSYKTMVASMDKVALTSDERRRKILAESNALVKQRTAQAELMTVRKNQLNATNQLVDTKLKSQQTIMATRQKAMENQQRQHQATMKLIEKRALTESSRENMMQVSLDRKFQVMTQGNRRMEMAQQRHQAIMAGGGRNDSSVLNRSSQYMLAGTLFYAAIRGGQEAISVLSDFETSMVGVKKVMGDNTDLEFVKQSMIDNAKEYGFALRDVGEVYMSIGRLGFSEKETSALAATSLMARNVEESFRDAAEAQELMTGAILNYGLAAKDSERLLDRLNEVSNNYATDSNKLLEGINRTGAAAKNAGIPINELIGYLTVLNQSGFSGREAGNALKSFIAFSGRDIAIDKLEKYVGTVKEATGEMMPFAEIIDKVAEKWDTLADSERNEVTQAIARGEQSSKFIALMNNYSKTVDVATTAANSFGSAQRENELGMETLAKQADQLKASWDELIITLGESGLLSVLKAIVHEQTLLVDGFNNLPEPMRNTLTIILSLGAALLVLNTGMRLFVGTSLAGLVTGLVSGTRAMLGFKVATDAANVSQRAFAMSPIGAALTAISVVLGVATVAFTRHTGKVKESTEAQEQESRKTRELTQRYEELEKVINDNTKSDIEITEAKGELQTVIENISSLMPGFISQWDDLGRAIEADSAKIREFNAETKQSFLVTTRNDIKDYKKEIEELTKEQSELQKELNSERPSDRVRMPGPRGSDPQADMEVKRAQEAWDARQDRSGDLIHEDIKQNRKDLEAKMNQLKEAEKFLVEVFFDGDVPGAEPSDSGSGGNSENEAPEEMVKDAYSDRKKQFQNRMNQFRHMVNMEADGYKEASQQIDKLQGIRNEFGDLQSDQYAQYDLNRGVFYGIDEDIHRLQNGKKMTEPPPEVDLDKEAFENAEKMLTHKKRMGQLTIQQEHDTWKTIRAMVEDGTDMAMKADEQIYQSKLELKQKEHDLLKDSFDRSNDWIVHQRAIGKLSEQEEYDAWLRVQARYKQNTELRRKADEQVYAAKQNLMRKEEQALDEFVRNEQDRLQDAKQTALERIQEERDAYVTAQDDKIKAIDRLIAAESDANDDDDYAKSLAEKQARVGVLGAAVGPEGIKERENLLKEIEEMKLERGRVLRRRELEAEKLSLQDDKETKLKAFDQETKDVENHYNDLMSAFENYSNDVEGRSETLKQLQILKESEKNETILKNLDSFVSQYQQKMSKIASLARTQAEIDYEKYRANQMTYGSTDSAEVRKKMNQENIMFRDKYGISQTDYSGVQRFKDGGMVQGRRGQAVPVVAHGGEMYINEQQQSRLFKLLKFDMPNYTMPKFSMGGDTNTTITNNFDVSSGDVNLKNSADIKAFYNQREGLVKRMRTYGMKTR